MLLRFVLQIRAHEGEDVEEESRGEAGEKTKKNNLEENEEQQQQQQTQLAEEPCSYTKMKLGIEESRM